MFRGKRHPGEDALIRWYMADRGLDALEPADESVVRHVSGCAPCAARFEAVCLDLDAAADVAVDAANAAFTPERLLVQRERILRRIDSQGAKVLSFPAADAATRHSASSRSWLGWVAVAAAAGLFVGLVAGRMLHLGTEDASGTAAGLTTVARSMPATGRGAQIRTATLTPGPGADSFMSEVDTALAAPRTPELDAIDAMTLRVAAGGSPIR